MEYNSLADFRIEQSPHLQLQHCSIPSTWRRSSNNCERRWLSTHGYEHATHMPTWADILLTLTVQPFSSQDPTAERITRRLIKSLSRSCIISNQPRRCHTRRKLERWEERWTFGSSRSTGRPLFTISFLGARLSLRFDIEVALASTIYTDLGEDRRASSSP